MIWNLGSINTDHVYAVPHHPAPGETLASLSLSFGLGGKGANQSAAAARAGAQVRHLGAVGPDGERVLARLAGFGVDVGGVARQEVPTGHAIINVDPGGENSIVLYPGANLTIGADAVARALGAAQPGDILLLQNETSAQADAAQIGKARGMTVVYSAAPFDVAAVRAVLPHVSVLVMNAVEEAQLTAALGAVDVPERLVTLGADGARWHHAGGVERQAAFAVDVVDTTGAGDTFLGTAMAARDAGADRATAMRRAAAAAALKVGRKGAADAIPLAAEVDAFLAAQGAGAKGA